MSEVAIDIELKGGPFDGETVAWRESWTSVEWFVSIDGCPAQRIGDGTLTFVGAEAPKRSYCYQRSTVPYAAIAHFRETLHAR